MPHPRDARVAPDDRRQIVLVLQGGGALGAYQAGVFEALHESGLDPDWVVGTSIGAIQAAIVAGNTGHDRVAQLRGFWDAVSHKGLAALWPGLPGWPAGTGVWQAVTQGLPGFFEPNPAARRRAGVRELLGYGCGTVMHLMRLVAPRLEGEDPTKDLDFQPARIRRRWLAARDDARRMIARRPWDAAVDPVDGLVVHDLP